jgi:F0F1-type ATP synthase assembly protein I
MRQIGILTSLPFIMAAGPLVGYFIGEWLDRILGTSPYLMIVLTLMGIISAGREVFKLVKMTTDDEKKSDDDHGT